MFLSCYLPSCDISVVHTNTFHRKPCISLPRTESSITTAYRARRKHFLFLVYANQTLFVCTAWFCKTERKQMVWRLNFVLVLHLNHVALSLHLISLKNNILNEDKGHDITLLVYFLPQIQTTIGFSNWLTVTATFGLFFFFRQFIHFCTLYFLIIIC